METNLLNKADVLKTLEGFPEQFTLKELDSKCHILSLISEGLRDVEEGRFVSHEEVGRMIATGEI
jgi:predicted transcriptional regulator